MTLLGIASSSCRRSLVKNALEDAAEARLSDWLAQERDGARVPGALLFFVAGPSGAENDRNMHAAFQKAALDLQAVHSWHAHIEQQARSQRPRAGAEELLARRERSGPIAKGADQPLRRPPHRGVVIHDRDQWSRLRPRRRTAASFRTCPRHVSRVRARGALRPADHWCRVLPVLRDRFTRASHLNACRPAIRAGIFLIVRSKAAPRPGVDRRRRAPDRRPRIWSDVRSQISGAA